MAFWIFYLLPNITLSICKWQLSTKDHISEDKEVQTPNLIQTTLHPGCLAESRPRFTPSTALPPGLPLGVELLTPPITGSPSLGAPPALSCCIYLSTCLSPTKGCHS